MPGYGYNFAAYNGKLFISPIAFFGTGFAVNVYRAAEGKYTYLTAEWRGSVALSVGYNGKKTYKSLREFTKLVIINLIPLILQPVI
jgi:hypothetical protein